MQVPAESMSRPGVASKGWLCTARGNWRPFALGALIVIAVVLVCGLYLLGTRGSEHAAIVLGMALIGMLGLGAWVGRR